MHADLDIDTSGLNCPLPILRAKKALKDLQPGQVLRVLATDPGSVKDFQAYTHQTGHTLLRQEVLGEGLWAHWIVRKPL